MSFGWSANDILSLAKLCYDIYSFCQAAPAELQGILEKLDNIRQTLEQLSDILQKSGLGSWKEAPDLEQHLHEVQVYLEPLQHVAIKKGYDLSKAKGLARLALDKDKIKRIEKSLDADERRIEKMKIDMIL